MRNQGELKQWIIRGLCDNCVERNDCTFRLNENDQKMNCNHFHPDTVHETVLRTIELNRSTNRTYSVGLCITCDHRDSCAWRTEESVIFHCEHFK